MKQNICRHCGSYLVVKQTKRTAEQLLRQYYYTAYYLCPRCGRIYHDNAFKVMNDNANLFSGETVLGEPADIEIWTDGACVDNGKENAKAAWAFVSGDFEKAGPVDGKQTNNRAEAQAVLEALDWAAAHGHHRVKIYSDSQITLNNMTKPLEKILANTDIFASLFKVIKENDLQVIYEKVAGHSGIENNERVDKLANTFAQKAQLNP